MISRDPELGAETGSRRDFLQLDAAFEETVHVAHSLAPILVGDMRVDVHRNGDLRMPEDLHHDPRRHASGKQERGASVSSVMQADAAQSRVLRDALERPAEVPRLDRSPGPGREHVVAVMPDLPRVVALRGLTEALPAQRCHAHERYGDARVRRFFVESAYSSFCTRWI